MSRTVLLLTFFIIFAVAAVAQTPLSFVVDRAVGGSVSVDRALGTIWHGRLVGVAVGGQPLGDVTLEAQPAALLGGRLQYRADASGPTGSGRAQMSVGVAGDFAVKDAIADVNLHALSRLDPRLRAARSQLTVTAQHLQFNRGGDCVRASGGQMQTDLLRAVGHQWGWDGPVMSGQLTCADGALALALSNEDGADEILADADLAANGAFRASAHVKTQDPRLATALETLEFVYSDGAYAYSISSLTATSVP